MKNTQETDQKIQANLYKLTFILVALLVLAALSLTACSNTAVQPTFVPAPVDSQPVPVQPPVTIQPATADECPAGGIELYTGRDESIICNGRNGVDGAPVQIIQFCPGVTTYPNNFQEVGILIGTSVYGVYSANNGFLTYLPPGLYQSNAIGNSCTFTINADGTVSH